MKLFVRSTAGLANFNIQGTVDTEELPDDLAAKVLEHVTPENLEQTGAAEPGAADMMQYEITLLDGDDGRRFRVDDSAAPELLGVLDELLQEIVRRKREGSR